MWIIFVVAEICCFCVTFHAQIKSKGQMDHKLMDQDKQVCNSVGFYILLEQFFFFLKHNNNSCAFCAQLIDTKHCILCGEPFGIKLYLQHNIQLGL